MSGDPDRWRAARTAEHRHPVSRPARPPRRRWRCAGAGGGGPRAARRLRHPRFGHGSRQGRRQTAAERGRVALRALRHDPPWSGAGLCGTAERAGASDFHQAGPAGLLRRRQQGCRRKGLRGGARRRFQARPQASGRRIHPRPRDRMQRAGRYGRRPLRLPSGRDRAGRKPRLLHLRRQVHRRRWRRFESAGGTGAGGRRQRSARWRPALSRHWAAMAWRASISS